MQKARMKLIPRKIGYRKIGHQTGFSLVEVLVTLVITSVALLSSISLQMLSKRAVYDGSQRTTAAHLANDLLSRLRSNSSALVNYIPPGPIGSGSLGTAPARNCLDPGVTCSDVEMAGFDLWQWEQHLDGQLETTAGNPTGGLNSAVACITGPALGGSGGYTVAIAWRGMTNSLNPTVSNCGSGSSFYGDGNTYRRVLVVQSFIAQR
jgi:type IV pilus assembly protein PilV